MRSILIAVFLLAAGSTACLAQCDKKVSFTAAKTEHLDENGAAKHAEDQKTTVEFNKLNITVSISHDDGDEKLTGTVKSYTCDWKVPFKEGTTKLDITLSNDNGESRDYSVTIQGKDGKITLIAEDKEHPDDKIKLEAVTFEEKS
ncbi:MAG TPA: hypothetical protein VFE54_01370 [Mucilaginibacter sp.]|jgi:major membrane immunogen (membrane-anchored lipoprotein)|nr:hypothetical protein [Mucilaginibacter sp.]